MDFTSYVHQYYKSGYLVYQEGGQAGKVCADHMNKTVPKAEVGKVLNKLGVSMCNMLEYQDLVSIEIVRDEESSDAAGLGTTSSTSTTTTTTSGSNHDIRYVDMVRQMASRKNALSFALQITRFTK